MERVALTGLVVLRWAALVWMGVVVAVSYDELLRPALALGLIGMALIYTVLVTTWLRTTPEVLSHRGIVVAEVAIATALVVGDGWAYGTGHVFSTSQSLGSIWPLAAVLNTGLSLGTARGASAGALMGVSRVGATLANGVRDFDGGQILSLINTAVFYIVAGALAGYVMLLLGRAEREISAARAREELARNLHDGVLQTLAVVQRRSSDGDLVRLAREQDRDLRRFLFGDGPLGGQPGGLADALLAASARFEDSFGVPAQVLVPSELPTLDADRVDALTRAVGEALTNAGKHAHAHRVTVFVEPDDEGCVFCSVKDDGDGFDETAVPPGVGITQSIVGRLRDVGGRAEVHSRPGHGTEVRLWL